MIVRASWLILALIHLAPALAFFKPSLLASLYGAGPGSMTYLLLHHRAALFVGVFVACVWAAFQPEARQLATIIVGLSMLSFLVLYIQADLPLALRAIAIADLIGLPFFITVAWYAFGTTGH
jgi:cbb3-type cytochrome oxidase subunit 3